jgi:hypothetical protein
VGPFVLGNGTFDDYIIDLPIIVFLLPLGVKINVRTSDDCKDCVVVGKVSVCCRGLRICSESGGGGLISGLFCWLTLFDVG